MIEFCEVDSYQTIKEICTKFVLIVEGNTVTPHYGIHFKYNYQDNYEDDIAIFFSINQKIH